MATGALSRGDVTTFCCASKDCNHRRRVDPCIQCPVTSGRSVKPKPQLLVKKPPKSDDVRRANLGILEGQFAKPGEPLLRNDKLKVKSIVDEILKFNESKAASDDGTASGTDSTIEFGDFFEPEGLVKTVPVSRDQQQSSKPEVPGYLKELFKPERKYLRTRLNSIQDFLRDGSGNTDYEDFKPELTLKKLIEKGFKGADSGIANVYYSTVLQLRELMEPNDDKENLFPWRKVDVSATSLKKAQIDGHPVGGALLLAFQSELSNFSEEDKQAQIEAIAKIEDKGKSELWNEDHIKLLMTFAAGDLNAKGAKNNGDTPNKDHPLSDLCKALLKARADHLKDKGHKKAGAFLTTVSEFLDTVAGYEDSGIDKLAYDVLARDQTSSSTENIYNAVSMSIQDKLAWFIMNKAKDTNDDFLTWYTSFVLKDILKGPKDDFLKSASEFINETFNKDKETFIQSCNSCVGGDVYDGIQIPVKVGRDKFSDISYIGLEGAVKKGELGLLKRTALFRHLIFGDDEALLTDTRFCEALQDYGEAGVQIINKEKKGLCNREGALSNLAALANTYNVPSKKKNIDRKKRLLEREKDVLYDFIKGQNLSPSDILLNLNLLIFDETIGTRSSHRFHSLFCGLKK